MKLSKKTKPATVYRGVSGGVLPPGFFEPDEKTGSVGGVEASFMSTSTNREVTPSPSDRPVSAPPQFPVMCHVAGSARVCAA